MSYKDDYFESEQEDFCYKFEAPFYLKVQNTYDKIIDILSKNIENIQDFGNELRRHNIDSSFFEEFKNFQKENPNDSLLWIFEKYYSKNYKTREEFDRDFGGVYTIVDVHYPDDIVDDMEESFSFENFEEYFDFFDINSIKIVGYTEDSLQFEICTSFELDDDQISDIKTFIEEQCKGEWGERYKQNEICGCLVYVYWTKGEFKEKYNVTYVGKTGPNDDEIYDGDDDYNIYFDEYNENSE